MAHNLTYTRMLVIQILKHKPLTLRIDGAVYEYQKPYYLCPVDSWKGIKAIVRGSTLTWNLPGGGILSYNQIKEALVSSPLSKTKTQ